MAKKQNNNAKNANNASIQRSKAYANQVKKIFDDCVDDILAVQKTIPTLTEGQMFSFDACPMNVQKKVEELLRRLSSTVTLATQAGIKLEWDKANASADSLLASVAGKAVLRDPHFSAYTQRNHEAMYNFMNRTEGIMKLSDRIWQTTKQLREEMEVALTVGIGEGKSAKEMAKDVKQYLNEPDLMFRRFRYKKGEKITDILDENGNKIGENKEIIWGKKWKKLEIDANGKKHFIDYDKDSYKTGAGYYKSAHKNAMRVTRTETNMAYKRSDQQRWQQFDFILGYHVEPCANHEPEDCEPDICEFLQGDYPKDFIFEGWHPCCKCVCTPIMMDEDEMLEMFDAQAQGKEYTPKGRQITDYPDNFKQWCQINADKIEESHKKGKDPYFIRHNWKTAKAIADDKWEAPEPEAKIEAPVIKEPKQEEKKENTIDTTDFVTSKQIDDLCDEMKNLNIEHLEVKALEKELTEDEIVSKLGGGDLTAGSCASLALSYIGNKLGYDVTDYRDGSSRERFSRTRYILAEAFDAIKLKRKNEVEASVKLMMKMEEGHEYYFATGRHAAIVRLKDGKAQYLELQTENENGFKNMKKTDFQYRFGASESNSRAYYSVMIDINKFKKNKSFLNMLGFLNTATDKQKKGAKGTRK